jgi:hypothetical protein
MKKLFLKNPGIKTPICTSQLFILYNFFFLHRTANVRQHEKDKPKNQTIPSLSKLFIKLTMHYFLV